MTQLEDLVRVALQETPAASPRTDPLAAIEAQVRRVRRRLAVAGSAAVACVVAAAVLVPTLLVGGSDRPDRPLHHPTPSPTALQDWPAVRGTSGMTTTVDGKVWTLQETSAAHGQRWRVVVQDSVGAVLQRIPLPGPAHGIAAGAGGIWTYGGGDGAYPDGVLNEISPGTGEVHTLRFDGSGPYNIAFVDGRVYVTLASAHRVVAVGYDGRGGLVEQDSVQLPSQVTDIVATLQGDIWVREDLVRRVVRILDGPGGMRAGSSFQWRGGLIGAGPDGGIWTVDSADRLINLDPELAVHGSMSLAEGLRIGGRGQPVAVVGNGFRGGWVGTSRGVAYYEDFQQANSSARPYTTAYVAVPGGVLWMTAAPGGGVILLSPDRSLLWPPPG